MISRKWLELREVPADRREVTTAGGLSEDIRGRLLNDDGTVLCQLEGADWKSEIDWQNSRLWHVSLAAFSMRGRRINDNGAWRRVQLDRESYQQYFDSVSTAPSRSIPQRGQGKYAPKEVEPWYKGRISELEARGKISTLAEDEKAAVQRFGPGLRDRIRQLRDQHAPEAWKKRGPKRSGK
jgi:hypothetical protein